MTASAQNANTQPQEPVMAGFTAQRRDDAAANDGVDPEAPAADDQPQPPQRDQNARNRSQLGTDFDNTEFMRLLAMICGIQQIPTESVSLFREFTLDESKEKPTDANGTLFAKLGNDVVEISNRHVETDAVMTPALAYKMAAVAALNPNFGKITLTGSLEERTTLFMAAQHFGLEVEQSSIPVVSAEQSRAIAQSFRAFEIEAGLTESKAQQYLDEPEAEAPPEPAPTSMRERIRRFGRDASSGVNGYHRATFA